MMMKRCMRAGRKKNIIFLLFAGEEACLRVIMNMNTDSTMQLSPNYWLRPEGWEHWTRPTSTAVLSPPTGLRLSTYESRPAKDQLTIIPVSMTQDQGGCREKEQRERGAKVSSILPAKWFKVMFDNEFWVCEMCHGCICIYRFTTFEYFGLGGPPDAKQFVRAALYSRRNSRKH